MNQGVSVFSRINLRAVTVALLALAVAFTGIMALAAGPAQAGG